MAKKDQELKENIDREPEQDQDPDSIGNSNNDDAGGNHKTVIKNANASGMGAMGRNDQEQTGDEENHSSDA